MKTPREHDWWHNDYTYSWREQERRARREWWIENLCIIGLYVATIAAATGAFIYLST